MEHQNNNKERGPNLSLLSRVIKRRLQNEGCTLLASNLSELSDVYIKTVLDIARALDATPLGIGSTFNNLDLAVNSVKTADIDFALIPKNGPQATQKKLSVFLKNLPEMPKRDHNTDVEAGRKYKAYDIYDNGRIALVASVDKNNKPVLGSLRLVDMNMKFPWTTTLDRNHIKHKMEGNPTTKNPIIDIGFPPHDKRMKIWLNPQNFNPTQETVGVLTNEDIITQQCDHTQIDRYFPRLTKKSQAIIAIRSIALGLDIPSKFDLGSFRQVAPDKYTFIYNLIPTVEKISLDNLTKLLNNEQILKKVIKPSFPYIYMVLNMIKKQLAIDIIFKSVKSKYKVTNILQLISLSAQEAHIAGEPTSGMRRDEAARIGRIIEVNVFDYEENIKAFETIKNED